jgi:hypothetical protein
MIRKLYANLILLPLYLFLAIMFYWMAESRFTFPTRVESHSVTTPEVEAGQNLHFETKFFRLASCRVSRSQFLLSGERQIRLTSEEYYIESDIKILDVQNLVRIPRDVQPGIYKFYVQTTYFCNPMDYIMTRSRTLDYGPVTILPYNTTDPKGS